MRGIGSALVLVCLPGVLALWPGAAWAAEKGEVVQADNLGMNTITWNLSKGTHTTVTDAQVLSEFVGGHYYFAKDARVGLMMQFSEQLNPEPKTGNRFRTFAVLPQVGWNVHGPLFVAGIFTVAPRTAGGANLVLGVQGLVGVGFEVASRVKLTAALEVPYNFYRDQTIGLTPLLGASIRLD